MEIVYCSKCGKMIPPGGVDEGKRYLVGGEAVCPKCYEKLPKEEHTGQTMVVSEGISLRPASKEPEPDYSPRPRTSKLTMPAAKRRPSTRAHPVVPGDARKSGAPVLLWAGAAGLVLAGLIAWLVLAESGRVPAGIGQNPGTVTRPPAGNIEPPPPSQPSPTPTVDEAGMRAAFAEAEASRTKNPEDYAGAIALFEKLRDKGRGSHWETDADRAIAEILSAREAAASAEMERLRAECRRLADAGDYDGALGVLEKPPEKFAAFLAARVGAERDALRRQAEERLGKALAAAEQFSEDGEPDKGIQELDEAASVKYSAWADRLKSVRERLEKEKADVKATAERKLKADAARTLAAIMDEFEKRTLAGDFSAAAAFLAGEKAKVPAGQLELVAGDVAAAEKLTGLLKDHASRRRSEFGKLAGREVELALKDGQKLAGKVAEVSEAGLKLEITYKKGPTEIVQVRPVAFADLARGELQKLVPAPEPKDADGQLAAAIAAIADQDLSAAEKALAAAGEHPLAGRWTKHLDILRLGEKEAAAKRAWADLVAKLAREKYTDEECRALAAALDAYRQVHGETAFARDKAAEADVLHLAAALPRLFRGKVMTFDPKALEIEVLWDFADAGQLADFEVAGGKWKVENGLLRGESTAKDESQMAWTRAAFAPGCRAACTGKVIADRGLGLALGAPGEYAAVEVMLTKMDGQPARDVMLRQAAGGNAQPLASKPDPGLALNRECPLELGLDKAGISAKAGSGTALAGQGADYKSLRAGLKVFPSIGGSTVAVFNSLKVSGRLDRAWLEAATRRTSPAPVPTAGLRAHWTFDRLNGDAVADDSGHGHNGRLTGGAGLAEGRLGSALEFRGKNGRVAVGDFEYSPAGHFTVSMWFLVKDNSGGSYGYMFSHGDPLKPHSVNVYMIEDGASGNQGRLRTLVRDADDNRQGNNTYMDVPRGLADGRWHHYALTVSGDGARVYVDGRPRSASRACGGGAFKPSGGLTMGGRHDLDAARFFTGLLDDVRVYDRALSAAEIAELAGLTWPFRESGGRAVIEAENFHAMQPGTGAGEGTSWEKATDIAGASGECALRALPREKKAHLPNERVGARLDYRVAFEKTGNYRVWVRLAAGAEEADTVFAGLDGKPAAPGSSPRGGLQGWEWKSTDGGTPVTVTVAEPGVHTFNIWVRESRTCIDKIILSAEAGFKPEDAGPDESPRTAAEASGASAGPGAVWLADVKPLRTNEETAGTLAVGERVAVGGKAYEKCIVAQPRQYQAVILTYRLGGAYSALEFEMAQLDTGRAGGYHFMVVAGDGDSLFSSEKAGASGLHRVDVARRDLVYVKCYTSHQLPAEARGVWLSPKLIKAGGAGADAGLAPGQVSLLDPKAAKVVDGALSRIKLGETVTVEGRERANCIVMHSSKMFETTVVIYELNGEYSTFEAELAEVGGDGRRVYEFIASGPPRGQFSAGTGKPLPGSCRLDVTGVKKLYLKCWIGKAPPPDARVVWINPRLTRMGGGGEPPAGK